MINEGAKILEEGIAASSDDIDTVYLYGYGFPAEVGGPMTWADRQGLPAIRERLNALAERHGEHWQPAGLIDSLATLGGSQTGQPGWSELLICFDQNSSKSTNF